MAIKCRCGAIIPDARVEILNTRKSKIINCVKCAEKTVERVAGFPLITGKNTYSELQIVSQSQAEMLFGAQARKGQSPGAGVRMKGH